MTNMNKQYVLLVVYIMLISVPFQTTYCLIIPIFYMLQCCRIL